MKLSRSPFDGGNSVTPPGSADRPWPAAPVRSAARCLRASERSRASCFIASRFSSRWSLAVTLEPLTRKARATRELSSAERRQLARRAIVVHPHETRVCVGLVTRRLQLRTDGRLRLRWGSLLGIDG